MTDQHPITPPPELFRQWEGMPRSLAFEAAYRAGADQELEACCHLLRQQGFDVVDDLRNARRPKPPSLAEEALVACERSAFGIPGDRDTIRRALERLQELEKGNE